MTQNTKIRQPIVTVCGHVDHGKCVSGDTIIPLVDGTLITAKELFDKNFDKFKFTKNGEDIIQETNNIILFSKHGKVILPTKVSHIWKRKKRELIEIKTAHGDIIKTTPEHPYFVFSMESETTVKAEDIKSGDYIQIPKQIKTNDSDIKQILIDELKKSDFLCFLNSNFKELHQKIKNQEIKKISEELSIKNLGDSLKKSRIRIQDLFKIGKHFQVSDKQLYDMIDSIKNSTNKQRAGHTSKTIKLPNLHEPEKLGYVLGCIAGDGHLSKTQILLDNNDKEIQEKYSEYLRDIFNLDSFVKQNHTCQTVINKGGLTFKKFVKEIIGFPDIQKSGNIKVPKVAQTNKEVFRGFFAGLIDTDGYVSHLNYSIELTSKSKQLINQCSILLLNFGIQSVIFEKKGFYVLRIANKKYINKFLENFELRLKRKLKRVITASEKSQSSRVFDIFPIPKEELKKLALPSKINKSIPYFNKYIKSQNLTESFLLKVLENVKEKNVEYNLINNILKSDTNYVKVISKRKIKNKEEYVYDFTVPETHNFIAERTLVHNTSLLDSLRETYVQEGEAGGITQKISFTLYPSEQLKKSCPLIENSGIKLDIPGFLFIDTPGHAAFTNLRKRGGSLADLAVLVIDINEGIKPQTAEVIQILKHNKTPFLIALNKIDNISGWQTPKKEMPLKESIESQNQNVQQTFNERLFTLEGALHSYGFETDLFYNINDFTKKVAIIPCSARTKQGLSELTMMLCGLSQKYLSEKLKLNKEVKGIILEVKKEKSINYAEAILYDGELSKDDQIAIADFQGNPIISKIRILEEIQPLSSKFKPKEKVIASTGLRLQLIEHFDILPGMPFQVFKNNKKELEEEFKKQVSENIKTGKQGIIAKADSLGSLEALLVMLQQSHIPVVKVGIGNINKSDIISAKANLDLNEIDAVVVGFNVNVEEDAKELLQKENVKKEIKILTDEVIYKLIENLEKWRNEKASEIEKRRLMELATICKLTILHKYVFRNSNPAIFGVRIEAGKLKPNLPLIDSKGEKVARVKNIQSENKKVEEAKEGMEIAISLPGINFERRLNEIERLYTDISESQFKKFKKNKDLLTQNEIKTLQEIFEIKRKTNEGWGV